MYNECTYIHVRVTSIYTCSSLLILEVLIKRKAFVIKSDHCDAYIYFSNSLNLKMYICVHMHRPVKYMFTRALTYFPLVTFKKYNKKGMEYLRINKTMRSPRPM